MNVNRVNKHIVIALSENQIILKVNGQTVATMEASEAMSFGEAMYKVGADIKMKESMK